MSPTTPNGSASCVHLCFEITEEGTPDVISNSDKRCVFVSWATKVERLCCALFVTYALLWTLKSFFAVPVPDGVKGSNCNTLQCEPLSCLGGRILHVFGNRSQPANAYDLVSHRAVYSQK